MSYSHLLYDMSRFQEILRNAPFIRPGYPQPPAEAPFSRELNASPQKRDFAIKTAVNTFPAQIEATMQFPQGFISQAILSGSISLTTRDHQIDTERIEFGKSIMNDLDTLKSRGWTTLPVDRLAYSSDTIETPDGAMAHLFEVLYNQPTTSKALFELFSIVKDAARDENFSISKNLGKMLEFYATNDDSKFTYSWKNPRPLELVYDLSSLGNNPYFIYTLSNLYMLSRILENQHIITDTEKSRHKKLVADEENLERQLLIASRKTKEAGLRHQIELANGSSIKAQLLSIKAAEYTTKKEKIQALKKENPKHIEESFKKATLAGGESHIYWKVIDTHISILEDTFTEVVKHLDLMRKGSAMYSSEELLRQLEEYREVDVTQIINDIKDKKMILSRRDQR